MSLDPQYKISIFYSTSLNYPLDSLQALFNNTGLMRKICQDKDFKLKRFLGSNHNINGSGFIFSGIENLSIVLESNVHVSMDFSKTYIYKISYINDQKMENDIFFEIHLIKNTCENTTIIKCQFRYLSDKDICWLIENKQKAYIIIKKFCNKVKDYLMDSQELFTEMTYSIILNSNYKKCFYFFRNIRHFIKAVGAENYWKVNYYDYSNSSTISNSSNEYQNKACYSVKMNVGTIINYNIINEEEKEGEYMSVLFAKTSGIDEFPCLNKWIKCTFFKLDTNKTLLIHETKIPVNTPSPICNTLSNYTLYCIKKCKHALESNNFIYYKKGNIEIKNRENEESKIISSEEEI